jgi:hypothetical protein
MNLIGTRSSKISARCPLWKALDPAHPQTEEEEEIFPLAVELMENKSKGKSGGQGHDLTV